MPTSKPDEMKEMKTMIKQLTTEVCSLKKDISSNNSKKEQGRYDNHRNANRDGAYG